MTRISIVNVYFKRNLICRSRDSSSEKDGNLDSFIFSSRDGDALCGDDAVEEMIITTCKLSVLKFFRK